MMARTPRRILAGILIVLGGIFMWFAPVGPGSSVAGMVMLGLGVAIEIAGIALEHVGERR